MITGTENQKQAERMQSHVIPRDVVLKHVNRAKVLEYKERLACNASASSRPLPGAAGQAFACGPIKAGGFTVAKVTPAHWAVLQACGSPLVEMAESVVNAPVDENGVKKTSKEWTPQDQWLACHVFTADIETVYGLLESDGPDAVKKEARKAFGFNPDAGASINVIMAAILEQMHRHLKTKIHFAAELEGSREISFFQEAHPGN